MTAQKATPKRYSLFVLAIALLLLAGAAMYLGSHDFTIRTVGLVACAVSIYLVRISNVHTRPIAITAPDQRAGTEGGKGPGRRLWMVSVVLLLMAGASYSSLYQDARHGGHEVLPVYVFAGVALACALVWSYLITKLLSGVLSGAGNQDP